MATTSRWLQVESSGVGENRSFSFFFSLDLTMLPLFYSLNSKGRATRVVGDCGFVLSPPVSPHGARGWSGKLQGKSYIE